MARRAVLAFALVAFATPTAARAATLTADYRFDGGYASSVAGAPALAPLGAAAAESFATETVLGTPQRVLLFPAGSGLVLAPTTGVLPSDSYTIAVLARLTDVSGYRRFLDFKAGTADTGLYDLNGSLDFYADAAGSAAPIKPDVYALVVLTRSSAGQVVGYVDGVQQLSFDDSASADAAISADAVLRFFRDNDSGSATTEYGSGAVARIRIWDGPLSPAEVAALGGGGGGGGGGGSTVPRPVLGRSVGAVVASGQVSVRLPGASGPVALSAAGSLPVGTVVDASAGVARITTAAGAGRPLQTGDFGGGVFKISQSAAQGGLTQLSLVVAAGAAKSCTTARIAAAGKLPPTVLALLHATAKGRFATRGRFSSATVRGTRWDTIDRCDGTLTRVFAGVVVVNDLRRHRQVVVRAGRTYLAAAPA